MCDRPYDFLIVGAGLYGSVFSRVATDRGYRCLVVERRDRPGGNLRCETVAGVDVHRYGPHIFHTSERRIVDFVSRYCELMPFINTPMALSGRRLYNLPFNLNTFYQLWGCTTPSEAAARLGREREDARTELAAAGVTEPANLEQQALCMVGRDVYEHFVRHYTEKQWGRPCSELPPFIINRLPVRLTFDNNYFNDRWQFVPEGGYNPLIERLLAGAELCCGCDYFDDRARLDGLARHTVYTGPIDRFYDYCYGRLEYRSLKFVDEVLDIADYQGVAVVNYCDAEPRWTRIVEHKHFAPRGSVSQQTVITREYPVPASDDCEPFYPVNDGRNNAIFQRYNLLARAEERVTFGGRLAEYRYYDMDRVIGRALDDALRLTPAR